MVLVISPSLFKRNLGVLFLAAMLLATTGCSESKRLSADAAAVAQETENAESRLVTLRSDLEKANRSCSELHSHMEGQNSDGATVNEEIKSLTEKKHSLETEIGTLRKDLEAYRKGAA